MENAAIRENFASELYAMGVTAEKERILSGLPPELSKLHREGDIHIHDLESFGKLYNCCTPDLYEYLHSHPFTSRSSRGKLMEAFGRIKLLITRLAVVQSGGIGFGNLDKDLNRIFEEAGIEKTAENVSFLEEVAAAFVGWVNETRTRFCRETYYVTVNLGLETAFWGRAVTKAIIGNFECSPKHYTKPNIVFKVCGAVNSRPGTENYDLFQLAQRCTADRMIPTYLLMDSAANRGCAPEKLNIMGCRTRVYDNMSGDCGTVGRGNIAYISINLPRIALATRNRQEFYRKLRELMEACCKVFDIRNQWIRRTEGKYVKFVLEEHLWRNTASLNDILRQGTCSIGFIGLSETVETLLGEKMHQSDSGRKLALEIVSFMNAFVQEQRKQRNFSLLATPGEMLSGRFCELDQERFHAQIQQKGFYTNSFHVEVDSQLSLFEKLAFEGPFHALCTGGSISYVEFSSALLENVQAVEDALAYAERQGVSYIGINFPLDICNDCGQNGTFDQCPYCSSKDIRQIRRVSGYLEEAMFFTSGKKAESKRRRPNQL